MRDSFVRGTMKENDSLKKILKDKIGNVTLRDHIRRENTLRDIGTPQTSKPKTLLSSAAAAANHNGERGDITAFISTPQNPTPNTTPKTQNCLQCEEYSNPVAPRSNMHRQSILIVGLKVWENLI